MPRRRYGADMDTDANLRAQIRRNLEAMARELASDPSADQRAWEEELVEVTKSVTLGESGAQDCHQKSPWIWSGDKKCQSEVTQNVTDNQNTAETRLARPLQ
jgi:hypothetical protein